jgi:hypothetical protein
VTAVKITAKRGCHKSLERLPSSMRQLINDKILTQSLEEKSSSYTFNNRLEEQKTIINVCRKLDAEEKYKVT